MKAPTRPPLHGLMAEFNDPQDVVAAARKVHEAGYRRVDAYCPYPMEALSEAMELGPSPLPKFVVAGATLGLLGGFGLEYWASVIEYPFNIGGRPAFSWPSFIPVAFETTVLCAALFTVLGMLALNGLPEPYHPVFNVPTFAMASRDRFFICIEATDPKYDHDETWRFLVSLGARAVSEVDH
jgi:hypothetical protein